MNKKSSNLATSLKGVFILLITAFIWGTSFVAQSLGMEKIQAFTFNGIRSLMGGLFLLPVILIMEISKKNKQNTSLAKYKRKNIFTKNSKIYIYRVKSNNISNIFGS